MNFDEFKTHFRIYADRVDYMSVYGQTGTFKLKNEPESRPLLEKLIRKHKLPTPYIFIDRSK